MFCKLIKKTFFILISILTSNLGASDQSDNSQKQLINALAVAGVSALAHLGFSYLNKKGISSDKYNSLNDSPEEIARQCRLILERHNLKSDDTVIKFKASTSLRGEGGWRAVSFTSPQIILTPQELTARDAVNVLHEYGHLKQGYREDIYKALATGAAHGLLAWLESQYGWQGGSFSVAGRSFRRPSSKMILGLNIFIMDDYYGAGIGTMMAFPAKQAIRHLAERQADKFALQQMLKHPSPENYQALMDQASHYNQLDGQYSQMEKRFWFWLQEHPRFSVRAQWQMDAAAQMPNWCKQPSGGQPPAGGTATALSPMPAVRMVITKSAM